MSKTIIDSISELRTTKNVNIISSFTVPLEIQQLCDCAGGLKTLYNHCESSDKRAFLYCGPDYIVNLLYCLLPTKIFFKLRNQCECNLNDFMSSSIEIDELKSMFPLAKIVAYYKSLLKILIRADYIVYDCNFFSIASQIETKQIIFTPDYNVGNCINERYPDLEVIVPHGFCPPLYSVNIEQLQGIRKKHPDAKIIIHPESNYHIHKYADKVLGYDCAYKYFSEIKHPQKFIVSYIHYFINRLRVDFPQHQFFRPNANLKCFGVKDITLEEIAEALDTLHYKVEIPENYVSLLQKKIEDCLKIEDDI